MEKFLFYLFAAVLVFAAVRVITARNSVHAALFLVLAFFTSSALWLLLEAEFLAIVLVLVYVGAVMVLFLFVIMMLDVNTAPLREGFVRNAPLGIAIAAVIVIEMTLVLTTDQSAIAQLQTLKGYAAGHSNTEELGVLLYTLYAYPTELATAVLLVAMVAATALALRRREGVKYLDPARQVAISREGRVRLVDLKADDRES